MKLGLSLGLTRQSGGAGPALSALEQLVASSGVIAVYDWLSPEDMTAGDGGAVVQGDSDAIANVPNAKNPGTLDRGQATGFKRPIYNNGAIGNGSNQFLFTTVGAGTGPSNAALIYVLKLTDTAFCVGGTNSSSYYAGYVQDGSALNPYAGVGTPAYRVNSTGLVSPTRDDLHTQCASGAAAVLTIAGADFSNVAITDLRDALNESVPPLGNCMLVAILDAGAGTYATDLANAETFANEIITGLSL